MSMSAGTANGHAVSEINVTPLIDVLLVLLIIFMIIVPVAPTGLSALAPQPPRSGQDPIEPGRPIVVQILGTAGTQPTFKINEETYAKSDIAGRLFQIFSVRQNKVMFIKGGPDVDYGQVASMIDAGHQAGVDNIGVITPKIESGQ